VNLHIAWPGIKRGPYGTFRGFAAQKLMFGLHCFPISIFWISALTMAEVWFEKYASFSRFGLMAGVCFV
jgi:hypothetical protein